MSALRLTTDRLELAPLSAAAAVALPADREVTSRELDADVPLEWPHEDLVGVLQRHATMTPGTEHFGVWVMIDRGSRRLVGDIGFHGPPDPSGTVEIGYAVVPDRRRLGYASEAAGALVAWALSEASVQHVIAHCDPRNVGSIRTLERIGFHRTGMEGGEISWRYGAAPR